MIDVDAFPSDTSWLFEPTTGVHQFGGGSHRSVRFLGVGNQPWQPWRYVHKAEQTKPSANPSDVTAGLGAADKCHPRKVAQKRRHRRPAKTLHNVKRGGRHRQVTLFDRSIRG